MSEPDEDAIDVDTLERALRDANPAVRLVPPRILRRVIKHDRELTYLGLQVPHRKVYTISSEALRGVVDEGELGLGPDGAWPALVILLAQPEPEKLATSTRREVLIDYWRLLFHAQVHIAVEQRFADGSLTDPVLRGRIERIGRVVFDEIHNVLRQEHMLLPPGDDRTVYVEFVATYLELCHFAPALLPHVFPGLENPEMVETLLAGDVDGAALFARTRPAGAPDPTPLPERMEPLSDEHGDETAAAPWEPMPRTARWLIRRAEAASVRGNAVRAATLRVRAARHLSAAAAEPILASARAELDRLAQRLQCALGFDDVEAERWSRALPALLGRAARGFWAPEARLLYDLQRVCLDHERAVFALDLIDWLLSAGRRPIKREQPHLRDVMISIHLRGAARRLPSVRLAPEDRARLDGLLRTAVARAETTLRERFRGPLDATLEATGIRPTNLPERVAYRKLIEELLDRVVVRGFLNLGHLRDACSRSNLKLPDLSGPVEFFRGDRLLQADRALTTTLYGVYRRGEVYLRWLQRLSALAFATPVGRLLTLYVALPYGGAFIVLEGLQHLANPIVHVLSGVRVHAHFVSPASVALLGTVTLGLINSERFRRAFRHALESLGRALRAVLVELPCWVLNRPVVRLVLEGRVARRIWSYVLKPLVVSAPFWMLGKRAGLHPRETAVVGVSAFLTASLLLNSRLGRDAEEILADEAVRAWHQFYRDLIPGLYRAIMGTFDRFLETVERLLYAVDEWLRFRSGQTRVALVVKAVLGGAWFVVAYLIRIYVNLLIEPQVNPIKHFPVVTVSHKIILPMSLQLTRIFAAPLLPLGHRVAYFIAGTTVLLLPGVFGFLVWELKENWRLYEANRRPVLGPVVVGDHGETLVRLLRPGFHSGTLPKLFAKLRKSERKALRLGREKAELKYREALHHVELAIRRFIERELLALVHESRSLGPVGIALGNIDVSTNRIRIELRARDDGGVGIWLAFEEYAGALTAHLAQPGWLPRLSDARRRALTTALAGLYAMSGVEFVRTMAPGEGAATGARLLSFQGVTITWRHWVETWERDGNGLGHPTRFLPDLKLLPAPGRKRGRGRRRWTSRW